MRRFAEDVRWFDAMSSVHRGKMIAVLGAIAVIVLIVRRGAVIVPHVVAIGEIAALAATEASVETVVGLPARVDIHQKPVARVAVVSEHRRAERDASDLGRLLLRRSSRLDRSDLRRDVQRKE